MPCAIPRPDMQARYTVIMPDPDCRVPPRSEETWPSRRTRRCLLALGAAFLVPHVAMGQGRETLTASEVIRRRRPPRELRAALNHGLPEEANSDGDTAIHLAAAAENADYLDVLLEYGMSKNMPNSVTGRMPIVSAMMAERVAQFERLIEVGADVGRADRTGNTPLHVAGQINEARFALRLLEAGAPADAVNDQGRTFQAYMFMTPDRLLSRSERRARGRLIEYLRRQGHALETDRGLPLHLPHGHVHGARGPAGSTAKQRPLRLACAPHDRGSAS